MNVKNVERISLLDSLDGEWIKIPLAVMQDVGPAVQTLGGLVKISNREMFVEVAKIASTARVPVKTVRKHLVVLHSRGWIVHKGRQRTRSGRLRRTATIAIPKRTKTALASYAPLPWWACCSVKQHGRLTWGSRAVLSIVLSRLMSLKAAAERDYDGEDFDLALEEMGGESRFQFPLDWLEQQTGLSRKTIIRAKHDLHNAGIVKWTGSTGEAGETVADVLLPNWEFRIVTTPASPGRCYLKFES